MTGSRKVLLVIAALAMTAYFLPLTRDELSWWWTQSHDHSDNYVNYLSDWPEGRHAAEARIFYQHRLWEETKRAEILQASMISPANSQTKAASRREQALRRDNFSWKHATTANTVADYRDYLGQFPQGSHAAEARQRIQALGQPAEDPNATAQ